MGISERIKAIRDEKRIKQIDVATSLNLDPSYYARLEKRGSKMTVEQLQSIADALGVSLGEVLGIDGKGGAEDGERVKELEKRVKELEDRVKDKDFIVQTVERERAMLESLMFNSLSWGVNHSVKVSDYEQFIKDNYWIVALLSGMSFNAIGIKELNWKRFWQKALNKFVKDVESGKIDGELLFGESYFSTKSESPEKGSMDDFLEWANDPANEVETFAFYAYVSEKVNPTDQV